MTISLLLRLVPEALAAGRLAGEAQHVETGKRAVVRDVDELIAFLRGEDRKPQSPGPSAGDAD
jgi:hypothetical protein